MEGRVDKGGQGRAACLLAFSPPRQQAALDTQHRERNPGVLVSPSLSFPLLQSDFK